MNYAIYQVPQVQAITVGQPQGGDTRLVTLASSFDTSELLATFRTLPASVQWALRAAMRDVQAQSTRFGPLAGAGIGALFGLLVAYGIVGDWQAKVKGKSRQALKWGAPVALALAGGGVGAALTWRRPSLDKYNSALLAAARNLVAVFPNGQLPQ